MVDVYPSDVGCNDVAAQMARPNLVATIVAFSYRPVGDEITFHRTNERLREIAVVLYVFTLYAGQTVLPFTRRSEQQRNPARRHGGPEG